MLDIRNLTRVHGQGESQAHALRGVDLAVEAGELAAVMGLSGSGKSTLLTIAGGLDSLTEGTVAIEGTLLGGLSRKALAALRRRSVGDVFQDFNLIPALTAAENVVLPRELDGDSTRAARRLALTALDEVGIPELADRFPDDMSGGQQQRVATPGPSSATVGWCWAMSRPARWTPRPASRCCGCCAPGATPARPASW